MVREQLERGRTSEDSGPDCQLSWDDDTSVLLTVVVNHSHLARRARSPTFSFSITPLQWTNASTWALVEVSVTGRPIV